MSTPSPYASRFVEVNDLNCHILEAGEPGNPLILLLHGFPELAYSWRKVIPPLAEAGFHVVAPDQRGFGKTTIKSRDSTSVVQYDEDPFQYRMFNVVKDVVALVYALGHHTAHAVVGHDFGSPVAGYCSLIRPDLFERVVVMSAPFTGAPDYPIGDAPPSPDLVTLIPLIRRSLAALQPPRKHYTLHFSTQEANAEMHTRMRSREDLHAFLRAYYHVKSADWAHSDPHPLSAPSAEALATLPEYYIMPLEKSMPETVLPHAPSRSEVDSNAWLPDAELAVYVEEYYRTGFQGGLNWYRGSTDESRRLNGDLMMFANKKVERPAMFIAGKKDWGVFQVPGSLQKMQAVFPRMEDSIVLIEGAGHWVQQEQPDAVVKHLLAFLRG